MYIFICEFKFVSCNPVYFRCYQRAARPHTMTVGAVSTISTWRHRKWIVLNFFKCPDWPLLALVLSNMTLIYWSTFPSPWDCPNLVTRGRRESMSSFFRYKVSRKTCQSSISYHMLFASFSEWFLWFENHIFVGCFSQWFLWLWNHVFVGCFSQWFLRLENNMFFGWLK